MRKQDSECQAHMSSALDDQSERLLNEYLVGSILEQNVDARFYLLPPEQSYLSDNMLTKLSHYLPNSNYNAAVKQRSYLIFNMPVNDPGSSDPYYLHFNVWAGSQNPRIRVVLKSARNVDEAVAACRVFAWFLSRPYLVPQSLFGGYRPGVYDFQVQNLAHSAELQLLVSLQRFAQDNAANPNVQNIQDVTEKKKYLQFAYVQKAETGEDVVLATVKLHQAQDRMTTKVTIDQSGKQDYSKEKRRTGQITTIAQEMSHHEGCYMSAVRARYVLAQVARLMADMEQLES